RSGTQPRSRLGKRVSRRPAGSWTFPLLTTRLRVRPAASGALVFGDIDRTLRPERIAAARLPQVSDGSETATGSANDQPQAQRPALRLSIPLCTRDTPTLRLE